MRNSFKQQSDQVLKKRPTEAAKGWFLTYPKCPLDKEAVLLLLQTMGMPIKEWVVARELHEDGTPHVHAFVQYTSRITFSPDRWDLFGPDGTRYHGNYQAARSWSSVQKYCQKGGDFISSIDTQAAISKRAARNKVLLEGDLKELVDTGYIALTQLKAVQQSRNLYKQLIPLEDRPSVCGIWIYGAPGVGKSHWVRAREPSLFIKAQNKWWDGYIGQEAVLIDDMDTDCLAHYLKIWADKWGCYGEVKGDTVPLNYKRFYVTSNFNIRSLFQNLPPETIMAIRRRFKVLHFIRNEPIRPQEEIHEVFGPLDR